MRTSKVAMRAPAAARNTRTVAQPESDFEALLGRIGRSLEIMRKIAAKHGPENVETISTFAGYMAEMELRARGRGDAKDKPGRRSVDDMMCFVMLVAGQIHGAAARDNDDSYLKAANLFIKDLADLRLRAEMGEKGVVSS